MRSLVCTLAACTLIGFALVRPASGAVVQFRNGQKAEGEFLGASAEEIRVSIGGQEVAFKVSEIAVVYFGESTFSSEPSGTMNRSPDAVSALSALRSLQSVTSSGVVYQDYSRRLGDAKIIVDAYTSGPALAGDDARDHIVKAMDYFVLAGAVWNARITQNTAFYQGLDEQPLSKQCNALQAALDKSAPRKANGKRGFFGVRVAFEAVGVQMLWECASTAIESANQALQN